MPFVGSNLWSWEQEIVKSVSRLLPCGLNVTLKSFLARPMEESCEMPLVESVICLEKLTRRGERTHACKLVILDVSFVFFCLVM